MRHHGVNDNVAPNYTDNLSHRFDLSIPGDVTKVGQNVIQVGLYNDANSTNPITFSDPMYVNEKR